MKKKHGVLLTTLVLWMDIAGAFAVNGDILESREQLFHNRFYLRYSHGFSIYLNGVKNGYPGITDKEIHVGMTFEPEVGIVIKDVLQFGVSYLYKEGFAELDGGDPGLFYDDVFFSGVTVKARYYLQNRKKIKIPIGIEAVVGGCLLNSGFTKFPDEPRGLFSYSVIDLYSSIDNYSFERSLLGTGYGGGISGSLIYQPIRFLSFGFDAVFRVIISEYLQEKNGFHRTYREPDLQSRVDDYNLLQHDTIRLNFTSLNVNAYISFLF